jgi:hypothetical protein
MTTSGEIARCPYCRKGDGRVVLAAGAYHGWKPGRPVARRLEWSDFQHGQDALRFEAGDGRSRPCPHLLILTGRVLGRPTTGGPVRGPRDSAWWRLEFDWFAPTVEDGEVTPAGFWLATFADVRDHAAGLFPPEDYSWEAVRRSWVGEGEGGEVVRFESVCTVLAAREPEPFLRYVNNAARAHCLTGAAPSNRGRW